MPAIVELAGTQIGFGGFQLVCIQQRLQNERLNGGAGRQQPACCLRAVTFQNVAVGNAHHHRHRRAKIERGRS